MLEELKIKAMKIYEENKDGIFTAALAGILGGCAYTFGLWRGRAEGLNVGNRTLIKFAEQVNKIESK